ncbi:hypothetical protein DNHGIG_39820 [Collibacillus ludicampi]|uniref:Uncharacterized protein n=1 Tax=Collibacillus ludicampi TaxID=2771369 RepID=A0AAV4LLQ3_9BACL|nr:hypothetical protein [Collibacillus ludicampi]GIM48433.1 hypothetical protein DNHGIG_39820 [Collibacillus ludicampi]
MGNEPRDDIPTDRRRTTPTRRHAPEVVREKGVYEETGEVAKVLNVEVGDGLQRFPKRETAKKVADELKDRYQEARIEQEKTGFVV